MLVQVGGLIIIIVSRVEDSFSRVKIKEHFISIAKLIWFFRFEDESERMKEDFTIDGIIISLDIVVINFVEVLSGVGVSQTNRVI